MSTADERIAVFQDTMDWIGSDPELSASISAAKKNTTVFYEDDYPGFDASETKDMRIAVSGDRSFQAAMRLHREDTDAKIAVMNFANAFHAGGGVTKGSSAQEESLCRTSTLYPLLYRKTLRDTFYKHHIDLNTPKATDSLIYTEGVIICKTDDDHPKRMPREEWVTVDVITVAAPDLRDKPSIHASLVDGGITMSDAELFGYHVKRAMHILTCAAAKGADILVLGAFGCGAFRNDPEVVARAYKTALQVFPRVFNRVEFAVHRPASGSRNYDIFTCVLGNMLSDKEGSSPKRFTSLTSLIDDLKDDEYGTVIHEEGHKGTADDPIPMPYITYSDAVDRLIKAVYDFVEQNPAYDLYHYSDILKKYGIDDPAEADVDELGPEVVTAVLVYYVRGERFCDGLILSELKNGTIQKYLQRLKDIDEGDTPKSDPKALDS